MLQENKKKRQVSIVIQYKKIDFSFQLVFDLSQGQPVASGKVTRFYIFCYASFIKMEEDKSESAAKLRNSCNAC